MFTSSFPGAIQPPGRGFQLLSCPSECPPARLGVTEGTAIVYAKSLMCKFNVNNRLRVVRAAMGLGVLPAQGA